MFADDPGDARGFRTIYTGPAHPYGGALWPIPALGAGYGETKMTRPAGRRARRGRRTPVLVAADAPGLTGRQ